MAWMVIAGMGFEAVLTSTDRVRLSVEDAVAARVLERREEQDERLAVRIGNAVGKALGG